MTNRRPFSGLPETSFQVPWSSGGAGPPTAQLTGREREVLEHVADGKTNAEVARLLWISSARVRKHLENAYEKLGVHTRTGAVAVLTAECLGQSSEPSTPQD
jgi:DNA-binding CsgD family transcriptional regulator